MGFMSSLSDLTPAPNDVVDSLLKNNPNWPFGPAMERLKGGYVSATRTGSAEALDRVQPGGPVFQTDTRSISDHLATRQQPWDSPQRGGFYTCISEVWKDTCGKFGTATIHATLEHRLHGFGDPSGIVNRPDAQVSTCLAGIAASPPGLESDDHVPSGLPAIEDSPDQPSNEHLPPNSPALSASSFMSLDNASAECQSEHSSQNNRPPLSQDPCNEVGADRGLLDNNNTGLIDHPSSPPVGKILALKLECTTSDLTVGARDKTISSTRLHVKHKSVRFEPLSPQGNSSSQDTNSISVKRKLDLPDGPSKRVHMSSPSDLIPGQISQDGNDNAGPRNDGTITATSSEPGSKIFSDSKVTSNPPSAGPTNYDHTGKAPDSKDGTCEKTVQPSKSLDKPAVRSDLLGTSLSNSGASDQVGQLPDPQSSTQRQYVAEASVRPKPKFMSLPTPGPKLQLAIEDLSGTRLDKKRQNILSIFCQIGMAYEWHNEWQPNNWPALSAVELRDRWAYPLENLKTMPYMDFLDDYIQSIRASCAFMAQYIPEDRGGPGVLLLKDFTPLGLIYRPLMRTLRAFSLKGKPSPTMDELSLLIKTYVAKDRSSRLFPVALPLKSYVEAAERDGIVHVARLGKWSSNSHTIRVELTRPWRIPQRNSKSYLLDDVKVSLMDLPGPHQAAIVAYQRSVSMTQCALCKEFGHFSIECPVTVKNLLLTPETTRTVDCNDHVPQGLPAIDDSPDQPSDEQLLPNSPSLSASCSMSLDSNSPQSQNNSSKSFINHASSPLVTFQPSKFLNKPAVKSDLAGTSVSTSGASDRVGQLSDLQSTTYVQPVAEASVLAKPRLKSPSTPESGLQLAIKRHSSTRQDTRKQNMLFIFCQIGMAYQCHNEWQPNNWPPLSAFELRDRWARSLENLKMIPGMNFLDDYIQSIKVWGAFMGEYIPEDRGGPSVLLAKDFTPFGLIYHPLIKSLRSFSLKGKPSPTLDELSLPIGTNLPQSPLFPNALTLESYVEAAERDGIVHLARLRELDSNSLTIRVELTRPWRISPRYMKNNLLKKFKISLMHFPGPHRAAIEAWRRSAGRTQCALCKRLGHFSIECPVPIRDLGQTAQTPRTGTTKTVSYPCSASTTHCALCKGLSPFSI